jgi:hypothetical protein
VPALIGCQLRQIKQAEAFSDYYIGQEETTIHANNELWRPFHVTLLIKSMALHASDQQYYFENAAFEELSRVP